jgi:YVTN family beta-propeller protein
MPGELALQRGQVTVIEFHLLGTLEAADDDGPVSLGAPAQRMLLAVLLVHRGSTVSSDGLIDALWGERPPATAAKIVQGYVSNLRRAIGDGVLVTEAGGYALRLGPDQTDAGRFEALVAAAALARDRDDPRAAGALLREGLALWRGPPLQDFAYEAFARGEIARLEESRLAALTSCIDAELALGEHERLAGELEALVEQHPLHEGFVRQLMLALYRSGRQADALACYRETRRRLSDELGLEPGPQLRELEAAILAQSASLDLDAAASEPPPRRRRRGRAPSSFAAAIGVAALAIVAVLVLARNGRSGASSVRTRPNSVVAIDPGNDHVSAAISVGAGPTALAFGAGSLWVANRADQTISQVATGERAALRTIPLKVAPNAIATADGGVWVAGAGPDQQSVSVMRVDPHFDDVDRTIHIPTVVPGSVGSLAGTGSSLWVASSSGELTHLDARSGAVLRRIDPNGGPTGIAPGAAGVLWLTDDDADDVIRVDPTGVTNAIAVGHDPSDVAVGAGGIWVTDTGDDAVTRIDPATRAVATTIPVGHEPLGVAVGAGSIWVADSGDGTVSRIDPATNRVTATIDVGGSPQDLAVHDGRVWVTVDRRALPAAPRARGATIRVVAGWDPGGFDPALAGDPLAIEALYATCAKLVNYPDRNDPTDSELIPEVARSLPTASDGGRTYTFTIRRGFRFSPPSDAPVTAATFKYTIDRVLSPRMRSAAASDYLDIVGARAYHAGRTTRLTGVVARGDRLIIHLTAPAPDLPARMAEPAMCVVPTDTPIDPRGVNVIPSAGPYRILSYAPGQGVVLARNPNYRGGRPSRPARITIAFDIAAQRAIAQVEHGTADDVPGLNFDRSQEDELAARYGPGSPAARAGHQRLFVTPSAQLDYFALNSHRPLFADQRVRQAVGDAIDRRALARLGDYFEALPEHPTDDYLVPGVPGYRADQEPDLAPDLARARRLIRGHTGSTVVLGTCDVEPCGEQAEIVKSNLAAIGLRVRIEQLPSDTLFTEEQRRHAPFDMAWDGWIPDYLDPEAMLNVLIASNYPDPSLRSPFWRARLRRVSRLSGVRRDLAYARLDRQLVTRAVPLIAFGNLSSRDFFSARIGCVRNGPYGVDLGALCIREHRR